MTTNLKKESILIVLLCFFLNGKAQKLKTIKINNGADIEKYQINKSLDTKEGYYCRFSDLTKDTLVKGNYKNDLKVGIWSYYDYDGRLFISYNHDSNRLVAIGENVASVDSFPIKINKEYVIGKVDTMPLFIGYDGEAETHFARSLRVSNDISEQRTFGRTVASFTIDKRGILIEPTIDISLSDEMDKHIINVINDLKGKWIPAKVNGQPTASVIILLIDIVSPNNMPRLDPNIEEPPYIWRIFMVH